ncbi:calcium-binding protein [Acrasis kona]|uniref:Calcium-binding protein n=1 Tax=Acrasis kona TaxID=1008807 RepID=A0AAW2Z618_9EUKA
MEDRASLRIVNITDIYKLDNFPSLKTLIEEEKQAIAAENESTTLLSILTGDFLAPYLLSSFDKGTGMTEMLNSTPIDIVIFGNHEDDIEHRFVCKRVEDYKGIWINTNMQSYEMMHLQVPYHIVEVVSKNGSQKRKIGFIGVLSDSSGLYRANAFNGAKIEDPHETIAKYKKKLEEEEHCDLVIPLCHLYVPQDRVTCELFDLPLILSGHDHHVVDEVHHGTRLLKAGADGNKAVVVNISWDNSSSTSPTITHKIVPVTDYKPDEELQQKVNRAYSVLEHLRNTQLSGIPEKYLPLSSFGSRSQLNTVSSFLWTSLRNELNSKEENSVDCVLISGGNVRGEKNYADSHKFTLEDLKSEVQGSLEACVLEMPGRVLSEGIKASHEETNPGFMQFDDGVQLDENKNVVQIAGKPFEQDKIYKVVSTKWDLTDSNDPWRNYFKKNAIPDDDHFWEVYSAICSHFAMNVWKEIWRRIDTNNDGVWSKEEMAVIDTDNDGRVSKKELAAMMRNIGFDVDDEEISFVDCIMEVAGDVNGDGYLSEEEIANSSLAKKSLK